MTVEDGNANNNRTGMVVGTLGSTGGGGREGGDQENGATTAVQQTNAGTHQANAPGSAGGQKHLKKSPSPILSSASSVPPNSSPQPNLDELAAAVANNNPANVSFQKFMELEPRKAKTFLDQVEEVTGCNDRLLLRRAFEQARRGINGEFSVNNVIEYIIEQPQLMPQQPKVIKTQVNPTKRVQEMEQKQQVTSSSMPPQQQPPPMIIGRSPGEQQISQPPNSPTSTQQQQPKQLVDLTEGSGKDTGDEELQRAIKLSLQEVQSTSAFGGSHVTQEDQDVSRALEASLLESQGNGSKRKRGETWVDPLNPHERERDGMWPVGLKNVGQTCWFSAVIQSLFYLPAFRQLVLTYAPQSSFGGEANLADEERRKKIAEFMQELRKLFALMVASRRKYVDPSKAVDILRGSVGNNIIADNNQQDVSEFTHLVLEWVEDSFKKVSEPATKEPEEMMDDENVDPNRQDHQNVAAPSLAIDEGGDPANNNNNDEASLEEENNPMKKLFYGSIQVEVSGEDFARPEPFGQYPLQVNDVTEIHESLEKSTAKDEDSSQERWFTHLPPVLFFSLSRFKFNPQRQVAEKIHNRLEFPEVLYMDRYMSENKNTTRVKREEVKRLKERRDELKSRLHQFTHYGGGEEKVTLQTVLQLAVDFASTPPSASSSASGFPDVSMASPPSADQSNKVKVMQMQVDSPCHSPKMTPAGSLTNIASVASAGAVPSSSTDRDEMPMDVEMASVTREDEAIEESKGCDTNKDNVEKSVSSGVPCPRHISDVELQVIKGCLGRWRIEVLADIAALEKAIGEITDAITGMYSEESLRQIEYRLHAVMVHEGSVDSGHYWAYVKDHKRKVWLKCNDNTVNEATWEELQKESVGGHFNTSAYSLVYIAKAKSDLLLEADMEKAGEECSGEEMEQGDLDGLLQTLPNELAEYVSNDNKAFEVEKVKWNQEQEEKRKQEELQRLEDEKRAKEEGNAGSLPDSQNDVMVVQEKLTYVNTHAKLCINLSCNMIESITQVSKDRGIKAAVKKAIHDMQSYFKQRAAVPQTVNSEPNLESFVTYLLSNNVAERVLELALYEQFSLPGLDNDSQLATQFRTVCEQTLGSYRIERPEEAALLREWHQAYHLYRVSAYWFVKAVDVFLESKFDEALDYFTVAVNFTGKIIEKSNLKGDRKTLHQKHLFDYLCHSLNEANASAIKQFKLGDNLSDVKERISKLIVPALAIISKHLETDQLAATTSQNALSGWCALLGDQDIPRQSSEAISDILAVVLDHSEAPSKAQKAREKANSGANRDHIEQEADLKLSGAYRESIRRMEEALANCPQQTVKS